MKLDRALVALVFVLVSVALRQESVSAGTLRAAGSHAVTSGSARPLPVHAVFTIPASNVDSDGPVMDDHSIVYAVALPRMHRPNCVSCGDTPFTAFHLQVYLRRYVSGPGGITVSAPRLLFTGPRGAQLPMWSFHQNWLIYGTYLLGDRWALFARNVVTGRQILLDSPQREGTPSRFLHADSDAGTVVWQSWTHIRGKLVSVIRSYSLVSGRRRLLLYGGNGQDYFYNEPNISGNRLVFTREYPNAPAEQLFLANLSSGRIRPLTPLHQENSEAAISGNLLTWVHGDISLGHTHGLVVENLATGHRVALPHSAAQLPRIVAGRYVVFAAVYRDTNVQVYDSRTGARRIISPRTPLVGPGSSSGEVEAGGNAILFSLETACSGVTYSCPERYSLVSLP